MFKVIIQVSAYLENKGMTHVDVNSAREVWPERG